jgi:hypothetical protein
MLLAAVTSEPELQSWWAHWNSFVDGRRTMRRGLIGARLMNPRLRLYASRALNPSLLRRLRPVAALFGLVAFIAGVVALFTIENSAGSLFLVTLGLVIVLAAILGSRVQLESFEVLGAKMKVREVVRSRLQLAERAAANPGDPQAPVAREQAAALQKLIGLYDLYVYIRKTQPFSSQRTAALDKVAARMQLAGGEAHFDAGEVSTWFHQGDDPLRVVALNLMLAREECRDFLAVLKSIDEPRSLFEQFYALRLGRAMILGLDRFERQLLTDAIIRAQRRRRFRNDPGVVMVSDAILAELDRSGHR